MVFIMVLDRVTGEFLAGAPFVKVNWAQRVRLDRDRPIAVALDTRRVSSAGGAYRTCLFGRHELVGYGAGPAKGRPGLIFVPLRRGTTSVFTKAR